MPLSWPLIGRSDEMRAIESAISARDVCGIVVHGAPGVGKSRLAREAMSDAGTRRSELRWTVGTSSARGIPLGAFNAWAQSGVTDTVGLLRGVIDSLTAVSSGGAVVLGIDDVHLLDDLSIFVVTQIAQRSAAKLVLTVLDDEPVPAAVREIWKVGRFERLDLQPLDAAGTSALVSTVLGGTVDPDAVQRLWKLTRGNPLYLRNIVEQEVADGRLVQQRGTWHWIGDPVMPPGLVELIESRIGDIPAPVHDVVDSLAVGEPVPLDVLSRLASPAAIEEADNLGLIAVEKVGDRVQARMAHPLYGEVRRRRAAPTRLRRLRGLLATELATADDRDDIQSVVRRAALTLDSDLEPDAGLLLRAAHGAVWLANLPLADRLAQAAVRAGAGPEPNFVRAHALSWLGRGEEAEAVLDELPVDGLSETDRARLAFLRASNALWALGDPTRSKQIIDDASRDTPSEARRYIDAFLAVYWFAVDRPDKAIEIANSLALADLPVVGAEIAWVLTVIYADAGRTAEAVAAAEAGYAVATASFDAPQMRFNIADAHVGALLLAGRIQDAQALADRVRQEAGDLPGAAELLGAAVAGRAALGAGRVRSAAELLDQAATGLSATHATGWGYRYQIPRATAHAMTGCAAQAGAALVRLDELPRAFRSHDCEMSLARAWVAAGEGAVSEAISTLLSAAERAAEKQQFAAEVLCRQAATQFGDRTSATRLRQLESMVEGPRVGVAARYAEALRTGDAPQLADVSQDFERMGDLVAAVDAAAQAAQVHRRDDRRGSALGCAARAAALAERCGVTTWALRQASEPSPLTDREEEIAMLIGEGLSNREVAERLTLSVRTVESHIYRAREKTGTASREELAGLLKHARLD